MNTMTTTLKKRSLIESSLKKFGMHAFATAIFQNVITLWESR